jgi:very-short-patch-repair endonuclease
VVAAVDTWCQLASILSLDELVIMGDGLVRRQGPVATLAQLTDAVGRFAGAPGCGTLRKAVALVRPRTDSPQETRLRLLIRAAGLPEPVVNHPILDRFGNFIAYGDLAYPREKVLVEYDGAHHFASPEQGLNDVDRLEPIMAEGWRVIRVTKKHLFEVASPRIRAIREALLERGWRPGRERIPPRR